jgi:photoactive yellow protein
MTTLDFDQPDLAKAVEALTTDEIDRLPFGTIQLNRDGEVVLYSEAEARQSGYGARPRLGVAFFTHIAPCMNTEAFRGRVDRAMAAGTFAAEFTHVGDFEDRDRELTIKIQPATAGGVWIFLRRET